MSIGTRIRQARLDADLTLADLAAKFGKSPQAVSSWEREVHTPSAADLPMLAGLLGVSVGWLLGVTESAPASLLVRTVPSVEPAQIVAYLAGSVETTSWCGCHFDCGPRSFRTLANDRANAPEILPGDSLIIDPDGVPAPGDLIMARIECAIVLRRYRRRADHVELVPANGDWPSFRLPSLGPDVFIGVVSETTRHRQR